MVFRGIQLACLIVVVGILTSADAMAQRGGFGFGNDLLTSASRTDVQKHAGILEDQIAELEEVSDEKRSEMREIFMANRDWRNGDQQGMMDKFRKMMTDLNKKYDERVGEILLDDQLALVKQATFRLQTGGGIFAALGSRGRGLSAEVLEKLNMTEEDLEEIKEKAAAIIKKGNEKKKNIDNQTEAQVIKLFPAEAQKVLNELMGPDFEREDQRRRDRGDRGDRDRSDRGDRGGRDRSDRERGGRERRGRDRG